MLISLLIVPFPFCPSMALNESSRLVPSPSFPNPVATNYTLAASYMTFWGNTPLGWSIPSTFTPLLGQYDSEDPVTADWHIKWAVEHGITLFYLDFGWVRPYDYIDRAARMGLMHSSYISYLNICIFYFPDAVVGTSWAGGEEVLYSDFDYLATTYFSFSNYESYNGNLIVILPNFNIYLEEWGTSKTIDVFNNLRTEMLNEYNVTLYIIAAFCPETAQSTVESVLSIVNATTIWGCETILDYNRDITYSEYLAKTKNYFDYWGNLTNNLGIPFAPLIAPGFNNTPYNPNNPRIVYRDIALFEEVCKYSLQYATTPFKLILFFTWNDFHEGTSIEPTQEYGFQYLDVIRKIYTADPEPHNDEFPQINTTITSTITSTENQQSSSIQSNTTEYQFALVPMVLAVLIRMLKKKHMPKTSDS